MAPARGRIAKRRRGSDAARRRPPPGTGRSAKRGARGSARDERERAERHKAACAAGRARKEAQERARAAAAERGDAPPKDVRRARRERGARPGRTLVVRRAGDEMPGRRRGDLPVQRGADDVPRKARELFARMAAARGEGAREPVREREPAVSFDPMAPGETLADFERRVREQARAARAQVAAGTRSRQREKTRAYYERRKVRAARRARRRRGDRSDSEDERGDELDDGGEGRGALHTVVEMLHERIAEQRLSKKRRRRRRRGDDGDDETPWDAGESAVAFGDTVKRPPELRNMPVVRGGASRVVKKRVVVSDAAGLIK